MKKISEILKLRKQSDYIKIMCMAFVFIMVTVVYIGGQIKSYYNMINVPNKIVIKDYDNIISSYDLEQIELLEYVTEVTYLDEQGAQTDVRNAASGLEVTLSGIGLEGENIVEIQNLGWEVTDNGLVEQTIGFQEMLFLEMRYCIMVIILLGIVLRLSAKLENARKKL